MTRTSIFFIGENFHATGFSLRWYPKLVAQCHVQKLKHVALRDQYGIQLQWHPRCRSLLFNLLKRWNCVLVVALIFNMMFLVKFALLLLFFWSYDIIRSSFKVSSLLLSESCDGVVQGKWLRDGMKVLERWRKARMPFLPFPLSWLMASLDHHQLSLPALHCNLMLNCYHGPVSMTYARMVV